MILTNKAILDALKNKDIVIEPFNESQLNPNSYDITLAPKLSVYTNPILDCKIKNDFIEFEIPESGYILQPGKVYIAHSNEYTESHNVVPVLFGKSSLGRLGLTIHVTAGLGDVGFCGQWVLELVATQPLKIYPNMKIAQIVFNEVSGDTEVKYSGKYVNQRGNRTSEYYKNFKD
jgi:dCTP deaminase